MRVALKAVEDYRLDSSTHYFFTFTGGTYCRGYAHSAGTDFLLFATGGHKTAGWMKSTPMEAGTAEVHYFADSFVNSVQYTQTGHFVAGKFFFAGKATKIYDSTAFNDEVETNGAAFFFGLDDSDAQLCSTAAAIFATHTEDLAFLQTSTTTLSNTDWVVESPVPLLVPWTNPLTSGAEDVIFGRLDIGQTEKY